LGLKTPILGKFWGKRKILSKWCIHNLHNLLYRKFAGVCLKTATSCPSYFSTHDATDWQQNDYWPITGASLVFTFIK